VKNKETEIDFNSVDVNECVFEGIIKCHEILSLFEEEKES